MNPPATISSSLLELLPDMCFIVSTDRMILDCNEKARETFSLTPSRMGSVPFFSLLTDESPRALLAVLRTGADSQEAEVRFRAADGRVMDARLFIRRLERTEGPALFVIARDVSEAKQKELDLLRFSNVVHYTVNPIQITDSRGRMIYVNPAFARTTGYTKEELIGQKPSIIASGRHDREFWRKVWNTILAGKVWHGEIENRRKNGEPLHTYVLISPIIDPDGKVVGFLGAHRDITKQKELEQQLMHSQKMESIGTLAAGIAHEVGNPLASISSVVQVLLRTMSDEFAREKLGLVQTQVHRITKIIRDLVDFSRPSNYQLQQTDIVRTVQDAVEIVKMGRKAREHRFVTDVTGEIPPLSLVPDQLAQVFINILLNAVDAMEGVPGEVRVRVSRDNGHVRVEIRDTGCGITRENMNKIFEPFFTTKQVGQGTGLGLWVSYGIVRSFRGDITVESEPGKGTVFTVILPRNDGEESVHG